MVEYGSSYLLSRVDSVSVAAAGQLISCEVSFFICWRSWYLVTRRPTIALQSPSLSCSFLIEERRSFTRLSAPSFTQAAGALLRRAGEDPSLEQTVELLELVLCRFLASALLRSIRITLDPFATTYYDVFLCFQIALDWRLVVADFI